MAKGNTIVLGGATTPLAVVQCLNKSGSRPIVLSCASSDISKYSRRCNFVHTHLEEANDEEILQWLIQYSSTLQSKSFVIPCSDRFALFVAKYKDTLNDRFKVWNNDYQDLMLLVEKTRLYEEARSIGLPVPPGLNEPDDDELDEWLVNNAPPYFVKPAYKGIPGASLAVKNKIFKTKDMLREFVRTHGVRSLVIQREIASGDGNLFDVYGLNDVDGVPVVMETHRRIRQWPVDRGITSYGEIPVTRHEALASRILDMTRQLFDACKYHGIYGVEWLRDPATDEVFLIDVNARPFSSIAHLADSGINLPYLAYKEIYNELNTVRLPKSAKHTFWIHFSRDTFSAAAHMRQRKDLTIMGWIRQVLIARSFAYWRTQDLGPFLVANYRFLRQLASRVVHAGRNRRAKT